ncbi:hypothetical protein TraAM80_06040 [Trypanosoma rangeli]|uniref:Uncharacterized protein n=1 Tax=Trypanosoma rangeli TaxID=5698 RepID=A0A3R7MBU5_TRYRA|nr:uncharacterized protein TraAM80_06040 [Trypanosoma rangeli]RNF02990.1 hypothetical protein TraAM80_06040 [Trypanosoma rangeli]|eukprot:RNF02990.1 hypothetical protein TraAM80_06040 [Trypanosoma rangeli]
MGLLEDGRLALYQRFPEGSVLYDPSDLPPREVPISSDAAEYGVTASKLVPYSHYEAYLPDPVTGELHAITGESVCIYVTNLPPNTTAVMLGRFFEALDMIVEADVFTTPSGECTGRGWVVFQDPSKLLLVPPVLEFFPHVFIYTALSDKVPARTILTTSFFSAMLHPCADVVTAAEPRLNYARDGSHRRINGKASGNVPRPPSTLASLVANRSSYYFVAFIRKDEVERSVKEGVFWTTSANRSAFYSTLDRGPVIIIFVLREYPAIFGYAFLLPPGNHDTDGTSACPVEWVKHHVFLKEHDIITIPSIPIFRMGDGVPLKPEIGESICQLAEQYPSLPAVPERLGQPPPNNGRHLGRGGGIVALGGNKADFGGFNAVDGGGVVHPIGDREPLLPGVSTMSPPYPLGTRPPTRGGHVMNGRIPPRRRSYNDHPNAYSGYSGGSLLPRKV